MSGPILALDLATRLGWCLLPPGGQRESGAMQLESGPLGRIRGLQEVLPSLLLHVAGGRGEVVYERAVTVRFRDAIRAACHLEATLLDLCASFLIPASDVFDYAPKEVKKFSAGSGNADKEAVLAAVRERWAPDVEDDNEADAIALAYLHASRRAEA